MATEVFRIDSKISDEAIVNRVSPNVPEQERDVIVRVAVSAAVKAMRAGLRNNTNQLPLFDRLEDEAFGDGAKKRFRDFTLRDLEARYLRVNTQRRNRKEARELEASIALMKSTGAKTLAEAHRLSSSGDSQGA
jgi:hypothetical protein